MQPYRILQKSNFGSPPAELGGYLFFLTVSEDSMTSEDITTVTVLTDGTVHSKGILPRADKDLAAALLVAFREGSTGIVPFVRLDWSYTLAAVEGCGEVGPVAVTYFAAPNERGYQRPLTTVLCLFGDKSDKEQEMLDLAVNMQARVSKSQGYKSPNIELRGLRDRPAVVSLLLVPRDPMEAIWTGAIVPPTWSAIMAVREEKDAESLI